MYEWVLFVLFLTAEFVTRVLGVICLEWSGAKPGLSSSSVCLHKAYYIKNRQQEGYYKMLYLE